MGVCMCMCVHTYLCVCAQKNYLILTRRGLKIFMK